jgi:hypothetical protein
MRALAAGFIFFLFVFRWRRVAFKDQKRKLGRIAVGPHPNPLPKGEGVKLYRYSILGDIEPWLIKFALRAQCGRDARAPTY